MTNASPKAPEPFSKRNPFLQIAWDATSLSTFAECPRRYYYAIVRGFRGSGIDLDFGGFFASAVERFYKARLAGSSLEEATFVATDWVVHATWPKGAAQPWGGRYETAWRCTGTEPYKNDKGNRAKCPYSHANTWQYGQHPGTCGNCGSEIEEVRRYEPENLKKNRITLIRAVVWYCLGQSETSGLQPMAFANGTPAVELPFRMALPVELSTGERPILCGYFDRMAVVGDSTDNEVFIVDNKTTGGALDARYFDKFSVNMQFDTYDLVGSVLFPDLNIRGVVNDAVQMLQNGVHFGMRQFYKTDGQRQEHLDLIERTIRAAEVCALNAQTYIGPAAANAYPMNKTACALCPFKRICNKDPAVRERFLTNGDFGPGGLRWNPLEER